MRLHFRCPCGLVLNVADGRQGAAGECPGCGRIVVVPAEAAATVDIAELAEAAAAASVPGDPGGPPPPDEVVEALSDDMILVAGPMGPADAEAVAEAEVVDAEAVAEAEAVDAEAVADAEAFGAEAVAEAEGPDVAADAGPAREAAERPGRRPRRRRARGREAAPSQTGGRRPAAESSRLVLVAVLAAIATLVGLLVLLLTGR